MIKKLSIISLRVMLGLVFMLLFVSLKAQEKNTEATWVWYPGDYEIWLSNEMQAKRTERGAFFPPLWRYYSPYSLVTFRKKITIPEDDVITISSEGPAKIQLDGNLYRSNVKSIPVSKGEHTLIVKVYNQEKVPALFVDGKYFKTDSSWEVTYEDKEWIDETGRTSGESGTVWDKVGVWDFNTATSLPSAFKLAVTPKIAVSITKNDSGILADFGQETFGFAKLHGIKGSGNINLYYGESKEEAMSKEHCETFDELSFNEANPTEFTLKNSKAFRYIQVEAEGDISFETISMLYEYLPLTYKGSFQSSDKLLNEIWDISAYTMHLTSREFFVDGIKRDRWVWSGDAYQSYLMNYYLFFDNPSVKRTIYALRGKDPVNSHINTIMDYSLYWFLGVYDYYKFTGDKEFINQIYPRMKSLMDFCLARRNENGMLEGLAGDWVFIDWADGLTKQGEVSFEQLLFARSLEAMALCAEITGDSSEVANYKNLAEGLKGKLFKKFWSEEKQAFIHNVVDGKPGDTVTRYTNMFAIFFDYLTDEQKQQVKKNVILNDDVQQITTPYMRFYELEALCAMGEQEFVLDEIRDYWGGMLDLGATSFWEKYNPNENGEEHLAMYGRPYGKSLCHAWGASPIYLFGKYYLGVQPINAGYETYSVTPNLGGLQWIEGKVPTPNGEITVYCSKKNIKVKGASGTGTLVFNSKRKPSSNFGDIKKVGANQYELTIEPSKSYEIKYSAL